MAEIITHDGQPALVITDYKGDDWIYLFTVTSAGSDQIRLLLTKLDEVGEVKAEYRVEQDRGNWWCKCMDYQCRRRKERDVCKHIEAVQDLASVILMFQTKEVTHESK